MIKILSGNYNSEERKLVPHLFSNLELTICSSCEKSLTCSEFANHSCKYRHLLEDIELVKLGYPVIKE